MTAMQYKEEAKVNITIPPPPNIHKTTLNQFNLFISHSLESKGSTLIDQEEYDISPILQVNVGRALGV